MTVLPLALFLSCLSAATAKAAVPAPAAAVKPAPAKGDTTTRPAASIVLPGLKVEQVKAKITARLMNRGWMIVQNRNDSVDFNTEADSSLVTGLFQVPYVPKQRVTLRFGLRNSPEGTQTRLQALLLAPNESGLLSRTATPADTSVLRQSLEAIQAEEFAPGMLIPTKDGPKKPKKKK